MALSPGTARKQFILLTQTDVRHVLPVIRVPTLILALRKARGGSVAPLVAVADLDYPCATLELEQPALYLQGPPALMHQGWPANGPPEVA